MKKIAIVLITIIIVCTCCACNYSQEEYSEIEQPEEEQTEVEKSEEECVADDVIEDPFDGFIHTENREFVLNGENILLRGVNAGSWLLTEDWLTLTSLSSDLSSEHGLYEWEKAYSQKHGEANTATLMKAYRDSWWQEQDFVNIADIGFNMVRLPFGWQDLTDENGVFKENAFELLDWFVANCEKNKLFVILDLHGAYGSQNGKHHSGDTSTGGDLFGNAVNEELTVSLWAAIAEHYADNKWIAGYDLLNEPEGTPGGTTGKVQFDFYDRLYKKIRAIDNRHVIFMEACWDANQMISPSVYGWENVSYEYHYYNWGQESLDDTIKFLNKKANLEALYNVFGYNVPVFIGEFNFFDSLDSWEYGLDFFEQHRMSWAMWTYKGCTDSNWVLYSGCRRTAETVVTPDTDYQTALSIFSNLSTLANFTENTALISVIKANLNKQ